MPMDLFRENAGLTRDFHPWVEGKACCPWIFFVKHFCETLDWKAPHLKVLKKYKPEDAQMEEIDEIIDECLAKIATYLT
ncbi:hypothetical protein Gste01_01944 [Geobacillus stearothermophilus ATCC 7953]